VNGDLLPQYLVRWSNLTLSRSSSKVKIIGQNSRSQEEMLQKVDGATSTEGFLVSASAASSVTIIKLMR